MGNLNINNSEPSTLSTFQTRFIISPHPLDPSYTTVFNLHEKLTTNKYILTILTTNDQFSRDRLQIQLCKKLANKKHILKQIIPIDHYLFDHQKSYCNQNFKCYLLFDVGSAQPLRYWLANSEYHKNIHQVFTSETVYEGIMNLVKAVGILLLQKEQHQKISLDTVYFNKNNNQFILADPYISPLTEYHQQYHSPEKLKQIKNQINSYDPYLSDLFSIGVLALRILGYPVSQCYTVGKNIKIQKLQQFLASVTNNNLKSLIAQLISIDPQVRLNLLNQIKAHKIQPDITKPRTLNGKVSSVRKSFSQDDKPVIKYTKNLISQGHGDVREREKERERWQNQFQTVIYRNEPVYPRVDHSEKLFQRKNEGYQVFQPQPQPIVFKSVSDQNILFPFPNQENKTFNTNKFQCHDEFNKSSKTPLLQQPIFSTTPQSLNPLSISMYHPIKLPTKSSMTLFSTSVQGQKSLWNTVQSKSQQTLNIPPPDKFLKNVSSTPNSNELRIEGLVTSPSQLGININQIKKSEIFVAQKNQNTEILAKPQELMALTKINKTNLFSPRNISAYTPSQQLHEKEMSFYRSSSSFESDHIIQNKIMDNLKQLENKISQAINSSRLNITQSQISLSNGLSNSKNQIIESIIVPRQGESLGVTNGTVYGLVEQIESGNVKIIEQVQLRQQNKLQPENKPKQNNYEINNNENEISNGNKQKFSPILVRESPPNPHQGSQKDSQQPNKQQIQTYKQHNNYDNINPSTLIQPKSQTKQQQLQKVQNYAQSLNQNFSSPRLEVINHTIPEQSDEESQDERQIKNRGDYVEEAYENGGKYIGYMFNGQRNGHGTFYYRDGGYYEGRWKNNMMCGFGKLFYETQKLAYEGEWYQDEFHGRGTVYNDQPEPVPAEGFDYTNMNESQNFWQYYQGDLSHDTKAGLGKLVLSNQEYYEGEFKNDLVHGKGLFHRLDGSIIKGAWVQGILVTQV